MSERLTFLSSIDLLPKKHFNYLKDLKKSGFEPKVIYDIGSCVLHWTNAARKLWPNAKYILFDAFEPAEFLYTGYDYNIGVLSNVDDNEVKFYQNDMWPGGNSYYKEIDSTGYFPEDKFIVKKTKKLDTIVAEKGFPLPDLVKIDVQGAELDVIAGGSKTLSNATEMIVELQHNQYNYGAKLLNESLPTIESYGWKCVLPLFSNNGNDGDYGFSRTRTSHIKYINGLSWLKLT
jgi:FkbM family methyltransferase